MKAAIRSKYCFPNQIKIENIDKPIPNEGEILIKVHATTVNRTDCANLTAKPFIMRFVLGLFKPRKTILGTDFAGEVVSESEKYNLGEKVFGFTDTGSESQAEYMIVKDDELFPIPEKIDYKQAASSLEGAHYAYTFIHKVDIKDGQKILINGATGGIDYTKEDFTNDKDKYDFIFDAVGKSTFAKCKPLLKEKGIYISSELGPYSQNILYAITSFFTNQKVIFPIPYDKKKTIPFIRNLLKEGKFKPVIDREYEIEDIAKAYEYVMQGQKTGNVVINIYNTNLKATGRV